MGHISRFILPGSKILTYSSSDKQATIQSTAAITPTGQVVVVVMNQNESDQSYNILYNGQFASAVVPKRSIQTLVWGK